MHSLTTRARAEAYLRQQLRAAQATPRPKPRRLLTDRQRLLLTRLLGLLGLAILGAALWPAGQPTRPLRLADEPATLGPAPCYQAALSH